MGGVHLAGAENGETMVNHYYFGDQITGALMIAWLIERLKRARWFPLVSADQQKLTRAFAVFCSALATAGIMTAKTWVPRSHSLIITISGLTLMNFSRFAWHWLCQHVYVEGVYRGLIKNQTGEKK